MERPFGFGRLALRSPWVLLAAGAHAIAITVASVVSFGHRAAVEEDRVTEIAIAPAVAPLEAFVLPEIFDRHLVPQLGEDAIEPVYDGEHSPDQVEDALPGELTDLPTGELAKGPTGGTPIGVGLIGHHGSAPSTASGTGQGGIGDKYRNRIPDGGLGGGPQNPGNGAVRRGLEWLRKHQDEDGRWDTANFMKHDAGDPCTGAGNPVHDVGVTGLALLAFLGQGNTLRDGPYRKVVRAGCRWLLSQQREDGLLGMPTSNEYLYSHSIATLALCEAYGLSGPYRPYQDACQRAVNFIAQSRNPYGVWRYQPRCGDNDTSITGWMVQALVSAKEFGLVVDGSALTCARVWFDSVTDPATGAAGYTARGEGSSRPAHLVDRFPAAKTESLTAVTLLCRYLMGEDPKDSPAMQPAAATIAKKAPVWNEADGSLDMYFWYYGSYALFQASGQAWEQWRKKLMAAVLPRQHAGGNANAIGSWDPACVWGGEGGRVYATAMMVLCLQASWRYTRILGGR